MTTRSAQKDSHPICPTCESDLTGREELERFVGDGNEPPASDNLTSFFEETTTLIAFLGALAQAGPHAAAAHAGAFGGTPPWVSDLSWLARELAEEAERRLSLLKHAGRIWEKRADRTTAGGKEG